MLWKMKILGVHRESRNGRVITIPEPVGITIQNPTQRVLFDKVRDANPFFHLMESIWMLAGEQDAGWLATFNKRISDYAEHDGIIRGAYGFRWRYHFGYDQLLWAVSELRRDPSSRRVVLSMWDQGYDSVGAPKGVKDLPCNTHVYLRIEYEKLAFTVCNRSNDMVWGMLGANAVHMTILQEVLARAMGVGVGPYTVMTNNVHIYEPHWAMMEEGIVPDNRYANVFSPVEETFIQLGELQGFLAECQAFVHGHFSYITNEWLRKVAQPVYELWFIRKPEYADRIQASDWRTACLEWMSRRKTSSSVTSTEPLASTTIEGTSSKEVVIQQTTGEPISGPAVETLPTIALSSL